MRTLDANTRWLYWSFFDLTPRRAAPAEPPFFPHGVPRVTVLLEVAQFFALLPRGCGGRSVLKIR
jgi:hypothetical protein